MGKYDPLGQYLNKLNKNYEGLRFSDIEKIIGSRRPHSARNYERWWNNYFSSYQARNGWLKYKWRVTNVDLQNEYAEFER